LRASERVKDIDVIKRAAKIALYVRDDANVLLQVNYLNSGDFSIRTPTVSKNLAASLLLKPFMKFP
jgi:hypothetical protein